VANTGETSTSQMSQQALVLRFLTRAREEVARLRACLPVEPLALEPEVLGHVARLAHKIGSTAETFGFPEISVIAGAVELLAQDGGKRSARERIELGLRLQDKVSALEIYVEHALAEAELLEPVEALPIAEMIPRLRVRQK
jgi:HPt (histidine-containing phosphotransfer) domain-containing protein